MNENIVYLSIGSNLGDKAANLAQAINQLKTDQNISSLSASSLYITEPVGDVEQDDFYNQALRITTSYQPEQLLALIHKIEANLKRTREIHWGPRTIDLDILFFNDSKIKTSNLVIPHPEIGNRRFVLIPLLEIVQEDDLRQKLQLILEKTQDRNEVSKDERI